MTNKTTPTLPTVTLPSGPRTLRRLGFRDIDSMVGIFQGALEAYHKEEGWRLEPLLLNTPEGALRFALAGVKHAETIAMPWMASLLGLTEEEMRDPEVVPLGAVTELVLATLRHPDVLASAAVVQRMSRKAAAAVAAAKANPENAGLLAGLFSKFQRGNG